MPRRPTGTELESYLRDAVTTYWHASGTAKMGRDTMSVVDGHLKVYGVENLRVADASIMPRITSANTMAPCVVIGSAPRISSRLSIGSDRPRPDRGCLGPFALRARVPSKTMILITSPPSPWAPQLTGLSGCRYRARSRRAGRRLGPRFPRRSAAGHGRRSAVPRWWDAGAMNSLYCFRVLRADRSGRGGESPKSFAFLLAHVFVVRHPGSADRRPPLVGADTGRVGVAHAVANVVVIADRVQRLALGIVGAALEQLRVEDLLFDVGVHVELVGERTPNPLPGRRG